MDIASVGIIMLSSGQQVLKRSTASETHKEKLQVLRTFNIKNRRQKQEISMVSEYVKISRTATGLF